MDYGKEDNLIWIVALDSNGEVWCVPNYDIRFVPNFSIGRNYKVKKDGQEEKKEEKSDSGDAQ